MQTLGDDLGLAHKALHFRITDNDMRTRNRLALIQTPHMQFMYAQNARYAFQIVFDVFDLYAKWGGLEEDLAGAFCKGKR